MSRIVIFGAGGRAGRRAVTEAAARGHDVTAVVRNPDKHQDLQTGTIRVRAGDVTDRTSVSLASQGHDAAINAAARLDVDATEFYLAATRALVAARVPRLVLVSIATILETGDGTRLHDAPDFPPEHRAFSLGHLAELEEVQRTGGDTDWLVLAPPLVFLDDRAPRTGDYRIGTGRVLDQPADRTFSYADLAVALVDEAAAPEHHRTLAAVGY